MNVIIIEDEKLTAERLEQIIQQQFESIEIIAILHSVESALDWLLSNKHPDLVLMDIELGDGTSFDILDQCELKSKIIFTTAYDEYALKAFKYNSIDYLLKPIDPTELKKGIEKINFNTDQTIEISSLLFEIKRFFKKEYKHRFLVKIGDNLTPISVASIHYFYSEDGYSFIKLESGKKYIIDKSLDEIIEQLNPVHFFRLNRKFIASINAISTISPYFNARLLVNLNPQQEGKIVISRERVKQFKYWLDN